VDRRWPVNDDRLTEHGPGKIEIAEVFEVIGIRC
jgi:hypothetical protein